MTFLLYRKETALAKLAEDGWTRYFVEDIEKSAPSVKNYLHMKICRKDRSNNFIVDEIPLEGKVLDEDVILLNLENGFATREILSKLVVDAELIIKGFKIEFKKGDLKRVIVSDRNKVASIWSLVNVKVASENVAASNAKEAYDYTNLSNLSAKDKVNFFGVVKRIKKMINNGETHRLTIYLTDESISFNQEIEFIISSKNLGDIDNIKLFDILRFHRATIEPVYLAPNVFKGFGFVGYKGFHFLTFNGELGSDLKPRSSSLSHTLSDADIGRVQELRNWSAEFFHPDNGFDDCSLLSKFIKSGTYQNLLLSVIAVGTSTSVSEPVIIRGWDGTKIGIQKLNKVNFQTEVDRVVAIDQDLNKCVENLSLSVDIFIYDEFREPALKVKPGEIIKLGNVHCLKGNFVPSLVLHGTKFSKKGLQYGRGLWIVNSKNRVAVQLQINLTRILQLQQQPADSPLMTHTSSNPKLPTENFDDSVDRFLLTVDALPSTASDSPVRTSSPAAKQSRKEKSATGDDVSEDSDNSAIYSQDEEIVVRVYPKP